MIDVEIQYLGSNTQKPIQYATEGSAALDLRHHGSTVRLRGGHEFLSPTGIKVNIKDPRYAGIIIPRSGLGLRWGIVLGNLTGLIDSDYQGEIFVPLWNRGTKDVTLEYNNRIAQLIFLPIEHANLIQVTQFADATERGEDGFGSTGDT